MSAAHKTFERANDWITAVVFSVFTVLPAALMPFSKNAGTFTFEAEKREAATRPGLPRDWASLVAFPDQIDAWLRDHFGLRQRLIHAHGRILYEVFHTSPSPKVITGRDGWLFLKGDPSVDGDPISDYRGTLPLLPYELERWRWQLQDEHDWVTSRGMEFLFVLVAGKEILHPEKLPYYIKNVGRPMVRDQFMDHLTPRLNFQPLDLLDAMMAARQDRVVYRLTDTHWNEHGSLAGIRAMIDALRSKFPTLQPPAETNLTFTTETYADGDLARLMGIEDVVTESFVKIRPTAPRATITPVAGSKLNDIIANVDDTNLPTAILFHDSFGLYTKWLFGECFETLRFRWTNYGLETGQFREFKPDIVMHMIAERRIRGSQRHEPPIQQESTARYFQQATNVLAAWDSETAWAALAALSTDAHATATGIVLKASGIETHMTLPPVDRVDQDLPIVCVDITVPAKLGMALRWNTARPKTWPTYLPREVPVQLVPGANRVYFPLMDPETTGSITVAIGRLRNSCTIQRVEIRSVPRGVAFARQVP